MSPESLLIVAVGVLLALLSGLILLRKMPKRVKSDYYTKKWQEIQKMCGNKDDWAHAIIHADMLLDEVLLKKKVAGKTMGERLVNAEETFSAKDGIWQAHKQANALRENPDTQLLKTKVKGALTAYRRALKDIGAL